MTSLIQRSPEDLLPAAQVLARYQVTEMTLYRWLKDKRLSFPRPIYIHTRRYWRLADLQAFEVAQAARKEAA